MLFAMQSGSSFFDVEGLHRLAPQSVCRSPADVVNLPKFADSPVPSSSPCATTSKWSLVFRIRLRSASTTLWPAKWPQWSSCAPLGCLVPKYTVLAYVGQHGEDRVHLYGIYERYETQRCMAGAGGIGYHYYARDLEKVAGRAAIPLKDESFCVCPDMRVPM